MNTIPNLFSSPIQNAEAAPLPEVNGSWEKGAAICQFLIENIKPIIVASVAYFVLSGTASISGAPLVVAISAGAIWAACQAKDWVAVIGEETVLGIGKAFFSSKGQDGSAARAADPSINLAEETVSAFGSMPKVPSTTFGATTYPATEQKPNMQPASPGTVEEAVLPSKTTESVDGKRADLSLINQILKEGKTPQLSSEERASLEEAWNQGLKKAPSGANPLDWTREYLIQEAKKKGLSFGQVASWTLGAAAIGVTIWGMYEMWQLLSEETDQEGEVDRLEEKENPLNKGQNLEARGELSWVEALDGSLEYEDDSTEYEDDSTEYEDDSTGFFDTLKRFLPSSSLTLDSNSGLNEEFD